MDTCVHPNDQRIGFVPQSKIKYAETRKPNYVLPIIGGAVLGIGLALWLRRKK